MGNTISPRAAADDIFADANTACTRANARGGTWKALADQRIAPILALRASIDTQLEAARTVARPLLAVLDATDQRADDLLGKVSDDVWNAVGRPASDAALSVIFPGGYAYYAEGTVEGQPTRMELLARLLESNLADVNYTLPSATITSPHPRPHLSTPGSSCRPSKSSR